MKTRNFLFITLVSVFFACNQPLKETSNQNASSGADSVIATPSELDGVYSVDAANSTIEWTGKKPTGAHNGALNVASGNFEVINGIIKSGEIIVDMKSIVCLDIKEADKNKDLVDHLKNTDFFSVDSFPIAKIVIKEAVKKGESGQHVKAELTIKNITNEVEFDILLKGEGEGVLAYTSFTFDRTKWNIKYKSKSVFPVLADKFIHDEIELNCTISGKKTPQG